MAAFTDIPPDVILETTFFLDLMDAFPLLVTCSSLYQLLSIKDFWLKTLYRIQIIHRKLLPCPIGIEIESLSLGALRTLAIRAYTLHRKWSGSVAKPVSIHTIPLEQEDQELSVIPGTRMVIINSYSRLSCWDSMSGTCIASLQRQNDVERPIYFIGQSSPLHRLGESLIPLLVYGQTFFGVAVVRLDYRNPGEVTLSKTHSTLLAVVEYGPSIIRSAALDEDRVALLFFSGETCHLIYSNFNDDVGILHRVSLNALPRRDGVTFNIFRGHFYVAGMDLDGILRIRAVPLGSALGTPHVVERIAIREAHNEASVPANPVRSVLQCHQVPAPVYGVTHIFVAVYEAIERVPGLEPHQRFSAVHFLPAYPADDHRAGSDGFESRDLVTYQHFTGIKIMAVGATGRYAAIMYVPMTGHDNRDGTRSRGALGLVHYAAHPGDSVSFCELDTKEAEIVFPSALIAIDDALGLIYVSERIQRENKLYVLSFV